MTRFLGLAKQLSDTVKTCHFCNAPGGTVSPIEIALPVIILLIAFLMKLFVDRSPDLPLAVETTYELPIDIIFIAITFAAAFVIAKPNAAGLGLAYFGGYVAFALLNIVLSRRSVKLLDQERWWASAGLFVANFFFAITALVSSMRLVTGK